MQGRVPVAAARRKVVSERRSRVCGWMNCGVLIYLFLICGVGLSVLDLRSYVMRLLWLEGGVSKEEVLDRWVLESGRNEHEAAIDEVGALHVRWIACLPWCVAY